MLSEFDWNDIPLILSMARSGSMSATARELGIDPSTVSRRIAALEKLLGQRLFVRAVTGYQLTDAGTVFLQYGEAVDGDIRSMLLAAAKEVESLAGVVRLSTVDFFTDFWLMSKLPVLNSKENLEVHLLTGNQNVSFTRREADFSLRLARPVADAALMMRKLGPVGWTVFGSKKFSGTQRTDWGSLPWIAYDKSLDWLPEMRWFELLNPAPRRAVRVNSLNTMVQACRAGLGLALLPCWMSTDSSLVRLSLSVEVQRDLWLLSHRDASAVARFKIFAAWLARSFVDDQAVLLG